MNEFSLFFVAWFKHDAPQHLVAGPFMSWQAAEEHRATHYAEPHKYCVVETQPIPMAQP